jgi:hypothetical protein
LLTPVEAAAHALFVVNELGKNALWIGILGVT